MEQLRPKKRVSTSYVLWLFAGSLGVHHFYLGRILHGLLAAWTFNLLGLGWFVDAALIPWYVRCFNARHTAPLAPYDTSRRSLLCRLPLTLLALATMLMSMALYGPRALHACGVVDIDRLAAQTQANPYDTLGLSGSASLAEAKAAYRRESLTWHPDRNLGCGKRCEDKMSEITKAFELIKKRRAPPPCDRTWEGWLQDWLSDWVYVLEVFNKDRQSSSSGTAGQDKARTDL